MSRVDAYRKLKNEVIAYTAALRPEVLRSRCEACPAWSLQDVLAHHIHAQRCRHDENFPSAALEAITAADDERRIQAQMIRDAWAESGVAERRGCTLEDLSDEWDAIITELDESMPLILDLTVHFDDIRETIDGDIARNGSDTMMALRSFHLLHAMKMEATGLRPVALFCVDSDELLTHDLATNDEQVITVRGTMYDLLRCLTSRRDLASANRLLDWNGLGAATRDAFPVYGWPKPRDCQIPGVTGLA